MSEDNGKNEWSSIVQLCRVANAIGFDVNEQSPRELGDLIIKAFKRAAPDGVLKEALRSLHELAVLVDLPLGVPLAEEVAPAIKRCMAEMSAEISRLRERPFKGTPAVRLCERVRDLLHDGEEAGDVISECRELVDELLQEVRAAAHVEKLAEAEVAELDISNVHGVGATGKGVMIMAHAGRYPMSYREALVHAAWVVTLAESFKAGDTLTFEHVLGKVRST